MRKWVWAALLVLPLGVGGLVYAGMQARAANALQAEEGYICPLTGEELPCPKCCPLNAEK
jgi:hypothetical protein